MRVLLTTIGSRGDVQPVVALAVRLKELAQEVRLCAPPDFRDWAGELGIPFTPVGPVLSSTGKADPAAAPPTPEQRRRMVADSVAAQFEAVTAAAEGCDVIVAGGYLVIAARTVAEQRGIPYFMAAYSPNFLPSPHHAPPVYPMLGEKPSDGTVGNATLWARETQRWNTIWSDLLNAHREAAGLTPVTDVRQYLFTDKPWLAADATLGPWPGDSEVVQTGAWILPDDRPLSGELEAFLDEGEPPVYFGFGSIRAPRDLSRTMIEAARALGRRAIVLRGWADLSLLDGEPDCLSIGEVNQQTLFRRVAAVVHHGGAGTTTAAARAGAPQVVLPQHADQHYWAQRIGELGIGTAHAPSPHTTASLTDALGHALKPDVTTRARSVATTVRTDGAQTAANLLLAARPV
ncbi:glycosyltransferase [Amycolatopsis sp. H20-H5]|uniref:glycosyltransferase n=1 Tax=Amycolatopsis sp. H20-H5 TaxID=3046309 RepID=UPI002DBE1E95|nr:glycosyltransferase [Amycolatopsis sp. H20-H5]MEC3975980.1 glycosyltransferase [Amycolatopsis sp. H20-H5]